MILSIRRSEWFMGDLEHYAAWYDQEAGWEVAERYLRAVGATLKKVADIPSLGHKTAFRSPNLRGMRCMPVERPYHKHLVFYRFDDTHLYAERAVHGSRNLPRRLLQASGAEEGGEA